MLDRDTHHNYTLGVELHFEQNYTLSKTTPKIQFQNSRVQKYHNKFMKKSKSTIDVIYQY